MKLRTTFLAWIATLVACVNDQQLVGDDTAGLQWRKQTINDLSPFEAAGVADFNADGKLLV